MIKKLLLTVCIIAFVACKKDFTNETHLHEIPTEFLLSQSNGLFSSQMPDSEFSRFYLKDHSEEYLKYFNLTININEDGSMTYRSTETNTDDLVADITDFIDFASEGKKTLLHINFNKKSTLKHFKLVTELVNRIPNHNIEVNPSVFIYDKSKLPDCDCTL